MNKGSDPITVLIIDHDEGVRRSSKRIIDGMGCRTLLAEQTRLGLDMLLKEDVGIVLLDPKAGDTDIHAVLRSIGSTHPHVLVIVTSSSATVEAAIEAMKNGANDFIPKPFEPFHLQMAIHRACQKILHHHEIRSPKEVQKSTLGDLGMPKSRIHTIVDTLPIGLLVTDAQGRIVLFNPMFLQQMEISEEVVPGRSIDCYVQDEGLCRLVMEISQGDHPDVDDIPEYEFSPGSDKFLMARGRPVNGNGDPCQGAVFTFEDISALMVIDRLKSEFIAKVSHELRSPLSTIHEQLAAVLSNMVGQLSSNDQHLISRAKEKTQGLISLIGDLLDLSRIESGAVCEEPKLVALEELLASIIDFLGAKASAKQQLLTLHQPNTPLPAVKADPLALESIFGNLITNAINYTPENGSIQVHIGQRDTLLEVQVADNGFGMESRHLERIFERFYRVKTEKTRYITGTGLGLPIVKGLVNSMDGTIRVESTPGQGSTFTVLLPSQRIQLQGH